MASLLLGVAGEAAGSALLGSGISVLGATITGAQIGGAIGALAGSQIDAAIAPGRKVTGPRISDINIQASSEGAPVPRLCGRMRVAGQLIWASQFRESTGTTHAGGKGAAPSVTETDYAYSISFAVGLCAGTATRLGRVWANGAPLDLSNLTLRFYPGDDGQSADPLIAETEGAGNTPAYRGLCYAVFEDMALAAYGNRIPQLQMEVIRSIGHDDPASLESRLRAVALIPGAGEFVYATDAVASDDGEGGTQSLNVHSAAGVADLAASLDELESTAPNLGAVSLVVGWFGDTLDAGAITVRPGVESAAKDTYPDVWGVNGVARAQAHLVSAQDGRPAYGGTPSDQSVVEAIRTLKARGLGVQFTPFLFMDVPPDNSLTDPYTGSVGQGAYPWRGRITCAPAPGVSGSPDKTGSAATQVANFFGSASAGDFTVSGTDVRWTGGDDWGWRRMVLHYAKLCAAAGGVDAFLIASELRGLTRVRSDAVTYPAVAALKTLAADVRAILGSGTKIGYAADWSEYNNHQTGDAVGAVLFNLDPLWADSNIDFVGIDNYMPLADWRDGTAHLDYDAATGPTAITDPAYLARNIRGGEDYDWYYAASADRDAQIRTPITDAAYDKPFVWRAKDLWGWWANAHYDRPDGSESATPTGWVPQGKPIVFTELGCPAIDKGANQPNVFFDPKSSESAAPYYSDASRDDLIQRRFLETHFAFWADAANNPTSGVYDGAMLDTAHIYVWCWDARPYPFFPALADVWGDAANYTTGHWLNGRLGAVALGDLVGALCRDAGFDAYDTSDLDGLITGYAVTDTMSPRDAITPLSIACFFDGVESEGVIKFVARGGPVAGAYDADDLVLAGEATHGASFQRAQETDLPQASRITYIDGDQDYRQASVEARRLIGASSRVASSTLPLVMDQGEASGIGQRLLQDAWVMRESASFTLPPSALALDPTDEVLLTAGGRAHRLRLTGIDDAGARSIDAVATDPSIYDALAGPARAPQIAQPLTQSGRALTVFLDLPLLTDGQTPWALWAAATATPWPGQVLIWRSASDANYARDTALTRAATLGVTTQDFYAGPVWRWDLVNSLVVKLTGGALSSADDMTVLGGANVLAVQNGDGDWEVLQFASAELTAPGTYRLTRLLRGQCGSESAMRHPVAAGARIVLLDGALQQLDLSRTEALSPFQYLWGPGDKPISDPAYQGATLSFEAAGLIPFAPCHMRFTWSGSDLILSWLRRDRAPGASGWTALDVPLSETTESYDLEIMSGATVVRTYAAIAASSQTYTAAEQAADFPAGLPNPLVVNVYQRSSALGRGRQKTESLYVR